jgi:transposase
VLNERGEIVREEKLPTTSEAMKRTFEKFPASRIVLETGTHSPWISRLLTELRHEVIVAHAQKVQLITKSWPGWRESIRNCWGRCGTAARKHKST